MRLPRRRTRAAVAQVPETVLALLCAGGGVLVPWQGLGQAAHGGRQVVQDPVDPCARRRIGVIRNQDKALRSAWRVRPLEGRRYVPAFAGVPGGNEAAFVKCRAGKLHDAIMLPNGCGFSEPTRGSAG